jgi:hypothetical protein
VITVVEYLASAYDFPNDAVTIDVISIRIVMNNNTVIRFVFIIESELTSVRINWYKVLPICVKLYIRMPQLEIFFNFAWDIVARCSTDMCSNTTCSQIG